MQPIAKNTAFQFPNYRGHINDNYCNEKVDCYAKSYIRLLLYAKWILLQCVRFISTGIISLSAALLQRRSLRRKIFLHPKHTLSSNVNGGITHLIIFLLRPLLTVSKLKTRIDYAKQKSPFAIYRESVGKKCISSIFVTDAIAFQYCRHWAILICEG